jgi:hypothetical protein
VLRILPALFALPFLASATHAQTWLTDPAFGARRNAYGPGVHMDATGRAYRDTPSNAWLFEPVRPNAYGLDVGSDATGRPVVPTYGDPFGGRGMLDRRRD